MPKGGGESCIHGHLFTPENTYFKPNGCRTCRLCAAERAREYRKGRAAYSNWTAEAKQLASDRYKRWTAANPERRYAHRQLAQAVRRGKIKKGTCERCGETNVHGHHDDYTKPLEVRWLCPRHHAQVTRETVGG